jgi:hypothetical protein
MFEYGSQVWKDWGFMLRRRVFFFILVDFLRRRRGKCFYSASGTGSTLCFITQAWRFINICLPRDSTEVCCLICLWMWLAADRATWRDYSYAGVLTITFRNADYLICLGSIGMVLRDTHGRIVILRRAGADVHAPQCTQLVCITVAHGQHLRLAATLHRIPALPKKK